MLALPRPQHAIRRRALAAATMAVLLGAALPVTPVFGATTTTSVMTVTPSPPTLADTIVLRLTVSPAGTEVSHPCGTVHFYETTTGTPELRLTASVCGAPGYVEQGYPTSVFGLGTHTVMGSFTSNDETAFTSSDSAPVEFTVGKAPTMTRLFDETGPHEANNPIKLRAFLNSDLPSTGNVEFWKVGAASPTCTVPIAQNNEAFCTFPAEPVGTYSYKAKFLGTSTLLASESSVVQVTVGADKVHASGVGLQWGIFYPITDAYRDTVAIRGVRDEPIAVTMKIYNPAGSLIGTIIVPQGTGAYSKTWNGRYSTGTIRPEGKYKIVQTLTDAFGSKLTVTSYVTLSKKKIYTYSKTISKLGSSINAEGGSPPNVTIYRNTTSGYVRLTIPSGTPDAWVGVGWELTLPTATIYTSFYVKVYGRHSGATGVTHVGAQNFALGGCGYSTTATWYEECFGSFANIPTTSGTTLSTYRTPYLATSYRSGTKVRVMVSSTAGTTYIYKAYVTVNYGVLKY